MEEPKELTPEDIRKVLYIVLGVAFLFMAAIMWFQLNPPQNSDSGSHPPRVSILRNSDYVDIRYLGGIDNGFVGDFKVITLANTTYWDKPKVGELVCSLYSPNRACFDVSTIDLATATYRAIGYNCT